MRRFLPFASLALFACYDPDLTAVRFACTGDGQPDDCPSGYTCMQSVCRAPGEVPPQPDGGATGGMAVGCASGKGFDVSKGAAAQAFACPGTFAGIQSDNANSLCAGGYFPCLGAQTIDLAKCSAPTLQGFFIANKLGEHAGGNVICGTQSGISEDYWVGCGNTSGIRLVTITQPCNGFSTGRDCDNNAGSEFNCRGDSDNQIEQVISTNQVHGVLCCK
jgi:hypothetical protein